MKDGRRGPEGIDGNVRGKMAALIIRSRIYAQGYGRAASRGGCTVSESVGVLPAWARAVGGRARGWSLS